MLDESRQPMATTARSSHPGVIGQNPMYAHYTNGGHYNRTNDAYLHPQQMSTNNRNDMQALAENFGRVNLQATVKPAHSMSGQCYDGGVTLNGNLPQAYMHNAQPHYFQYPAQSMQHHNMANGYGMYPGYVNPAQFQYQANMIGSHSPLSSGFAPSSRVPSFEVPSLVTPRRDSASSQEGDAPGTPLTHYTGHGDYNNNVGVVGRSPHGTFWSTPSPTGPFKHQQRSSISPRLQLLVQQAPEIPHAIPAPYSPVKPLDRSLENPHGITNVYIRGLLPDTTDEKLKALAGRFGDIVSSKSIIDHSSNQCKGFGFVKFYNFKDAEDCIRGFHHLGYESSFARESFYSQLKKLHDDDNTNLYVSNLPKDINEHELGAIFAPHKVCSSRILRDGQGNGRGVGFARFESRDVCEIVIKLFNNTPVHKGGDEQLVQIRYADTPDQKHLKQTTTLARQYRTAEYESVTQGRTPFMSPATLSTQGLPAVGSGRPSYESYHEDFEKYMKSATGSNRGYGSVRDRLDTVSSHMSTPQTTSASIVMPATNGAASAHAPTETAVNVEAKAAEESSGTD